MATLQMIPGLEYAIRFLPAKLRVLAALHGLPSNSVIFVNSVTGTDAAGRGTRDAPLATWDYAYNTAAGYADNSKGDIIVLMAGHAETILTAGAIAIDKIGAEVIGLGKGANKPTITFGAAATPASTAASVLITAASTKISNVRGVAGIDGLTNPFHVQAADCDLDIEWRDGSATVEALRAVLTTAAADRLKIALKYWGFTAGDAVVNAIRLVGVDGADILLEAYGVCTTAWVQFVTTACTNVHVTGRMFTQGITNFTRDVVDTIGGSTWSAEFFDASAGASISGGSAAALAADDISVVATNLNVPTADSAANVLMRDVVGNKTDAAIADTIEGAAATTQSLDALSKAILQRIGADSANNTAATTLTAANADGSMLERQEYLQTTQAVPVADAATNVLMRDVVGIKTDAAIADTIEGAAAVTQSLVALVKAALQRLGADSANNTAATTLVAANRDGSVLERLEYQHSQDPVTVTRATAALPQTAAAAIFTITGLVEVTRIVGYVTTVIGAIANATKLVGNSTGAGASTDLCATLDINGHAVDSRYEITGVFADALVRTLDVPLAVVQTATLVLPPGTIDLNCAGSDGGTGRVRWSITYRPLEVGATIVAA